MGRWMSIAKIKQKAAEFTRKSFFAAVLVHRSGNDPIFFAGKICEFCVYFHRFDFAKTARINKLVMPQIQWGSACS
jgi:hypothetical protein